MTPHEETSPEGTAPAKRGPARRSRRGGRGRRRPAADTSKSSPADEANPTIPAVEVENRELTVANSELPQSPILHPPSSSPEEREAEREPEPERAVGRPELPPRRDFRPAAPAAVVEAIEEVNVIIASLKQVLDQMEEILETLELAEVQKTADEREIQSLRSALRQLDRRGYGTRPELPSKLEGAEQRGPEPRRRDDRRSSRG